MNHAHFHTISIFDLPCKANLKVCMNIADRPRKSCTTLTQSFPLEVCTLQNLLVLFPAEKLIYLLTTLIIKTKIFLLCCSERLQIKDQLKETRFDRFGGRNACSVKGLKLSLERSDPKNWPRKVTSRKYLIKASSQTRTNYWPCSFEY